MKNESYLHMARERAAVFANEIRGTGPAGGRTIPVMQSVRFPRTLFVSLYPCLLAAQTTGILNLYPVNPAVEQAAN